MVNFLANLVDRLDRETATVRPRPPALFEPVTRIDSPAWAEEDQRASGDPGSPRNESSEAPGGRPSLSPGQGRPRARLSSPRTGAPELPETKPAPLRQATQPDEREALLPARMRILSQQTISRPGRQRQIPGDEAAPQGEAPPRERGWAASIGRGNPSPEKQPPRRRSESPIEPARSSSIQPKIQAAAISPQAEALLPQISPAGRAFPAETTVNITIGSVEVIAAPPARPTGMQKQARRNAPLSLDEYLDRRDRERPT